LSSQKDNVIPDGVRAVYSWYAPIASVDRYVAAGESRCQREVVTPRDVIGAPTCRPLKTATVPAVVAMLAS
jgi:hypothetical protein